MGGGHSKHSRRSAQRADPPRCTRCDRRCNTNNNSEERVPCTKPCAWVCPHRGKCVLPCGAPCVRLPCDERCRRRLACGCRCPGVCGDPCHEGFCRLHPRTPDLLAQTVDLIALTEFADHDPDTDGPLVILGCGHAFTLETMDAHVGLGATYERAADGTWLRPVVGDVGGPPKTCPVCREPVTGTRRYGRPVAIAMLHDMTAAFHRTINNRLAEVSARLAEQEEAMAAVDSAAQAARCLATEAGRVVEELKKSVQDIIKMGKVVLRPPGLEVHEAAMAAVTRAKAPVDVRKDQIDALRGLHAALGPDTALMARILLALKTCRTSREIAAKTHAVATMCSATRAAYEAARTAAQGYALYVVGDGGRAERPGDATLRAHKAALLDRMRAARTEHRACLAEAVRHFRRLGVQDRANALRVERADFSAAAAVQQQIIFEGLERSVLEQVIRALAAVDARLAYPHHQHRCPNGHIYFVGGCGNAEQSGRCADCGAFIGWRLYW